MTVKTTLYRPDVAPCPVCGEAARIIETTSSHALEGRMVSITTSCCDCTSIAEIRDLRQALADERELRQDAESRLRAIREHVGGWNR